MLTSMLQGSQQLWVALVVLFVERVRVSLDLSFVEKLAKTQDFFCTPPVLGSVDLPLLTLPAVTRGTAAGAACTAVPLLELQLYPRGQPLAVPAVGQHSSIEPGSPPGREGPCPPYYTMPGRRYSRSRSRSPPRGVHRRSRSRSRSPPRYRRSRSRSPPPRRYRDGGGDGRRSPAPRGGGGGGGRRERSGSPRGPEDGVDVLKLEGEAVAYLLGRDGSRCAPCQRRVQLLRACPSCALTAPNRTSHRDGSLRGRSCSKRRLEGSTRCRVEVGQDQVEIFGKDHERELCKLCIQMTLQQRQGQMKIDFRDVERRGDCETIDVPKACVGFILGSRGSTLRQFEEQSSTCVAKLCAPPSPDSVSVVCLHVINADICRSTLGMPCAR
jgi:hypothetical protein